MSIDKTVSKALGLSEESGKRGEVLVWAGWPGFVATFNSREFVFAVTLTAIMTLIVVIMFGTSDLPIEFSAMMMVIVCSLILLFIGWVRQVCRYIKTLGMLYAVTDLRVVIIKHREIVAEMSIDSIKSVAVDKKSKLFGNGTVVFNQGEDYFKNNMLEAPPNIKKGVFAFFNVLDPDNVLTYIQGL
jgi:hypothetical protein